MIEMKEYLHNLFRTNSDEKSRKGFLRLDMNEGVPGLPYDFVKDVISEINPEFLSTYPEYGALKEKIAFYNNLKPENITLSNGSNGAIKHIFDAYISPGNRVLMTEPTFAMYPVYCEMFNAEPIFVEYNSDLSFPKQNFINKLSSGVKMAVVVNPNNPTGSALDRENLILIIKKASDADVLIVVDEAYFYFYPESVIEEIKNFKNLIVLRTFSKLCGMAAARLGYAASCPEITEGLKKVKPTYDVNGLAVLFAQHLLDRPGIIQSLISSANEGKEYLIRKLSEEGIEHKVGSANFILIKCKERVSEIKDKLEAKNILVSGGFKQNFLKDYIRVTTGSKAVMERFWESFIKIWNT